MNYSLATLWHERARYIPGVLAVMFSAVLMALQCGLLLGLFAITSIPIDHSRAHLWLGSPEVLSVDLGRPIPVDLMSRLANMPGVEPPELYYQAFANWTKPGGGSDLCIVIGSNLNEGNLGSIDELTPELRYALTEPMSVVVDESELERLGLKSVGETGEINKQKVRVVGVVRGLKSLAGPYVFTSQHTARKLLQFVVPRDNCTYLLARMKNPEDAPKVVEELRARYKDQHDMSIFTSSEFSIHSRLHWLFKTKAGIAIGYAAFLGLIVGMVVTSQTLYAATTASAREYAILLALGIPRWRVSITVLIQSFWVGLMGTVLAYPAVLGLSEGASALGVKVLLPIELLVAAAGITMTMAIISGMMALRSVRKIEPMTLLR